MTRLAFVLVTLYAWLLAFSVFDRGWGGVRLVLLAAGLGGVTALAWARPLRANGAPTRSIRPILLGLVLGAMAGDVAVGAASVVVTARTGEIRLDQGEATYRAALLLVRGEDPWGRRALLDPEAYLRRLPRRMALGDAPAMTQAAIDANLHRYWQTLDPGLRDVLLPAPPPKAENESAMLGYKYGPVPVLAILPAAVMLGPAAVPLMQVAATFALWGVLALLLAESAGGDAFLLATAVLLIDPHVLRNFLYLTASDVWPLLFGATAVLAARKGAPVATGVALGLALGSKILPAVLYLPLLGAMRSRAAAAACLAVVSVVYAPFAWWDAMGLTHDLIAWPAEMAPDDTSWVGSVPPFLAAWARLVAGAGVLLVAWRWATGREPGAPRPLAMLAILSVATAPQFHNNYVPWFSVWMVVAAAEALAGTAQPASASAARFARLRA
jgi:hypothetical protein